MSGHAHASCTRVALGGEQRAAAVGCESACRAIQRGEAPESSRSATIRTLEGTRRWSDNAGSSGKRERKREKADAREMQRTEAHMYREEGRG